MNQTKTINMGYMEVVFDSLYLMADLLLGLYFLVTATNPAHILFGVMALLLGGGDAFHLVPRMRAALTQDRQRFVKPLGRGKMITSITMTIFYILLWHTGLLCYELKLPVLTGVVYALATLRIALCLFPQNGWTEENASLHWNIYRNIPFLLLGGMVMMLFLKNSSMDPLSLRFMWLAILLSYAFYLPVVLFVHKKPKIGMLMLPKSCAYVWILMMGIGV